MFSSRSSLFLISTAFLALSSCVATTTDIDRLQDDLKIMERTQGQMQKSQADLISKMDELDRSLIALSEKLDESQKKMSMLTAKLEDTQSGLGNRMDLIAHLLSQATTQASVPLPGELYRTAYSDYQAGKKDLAISGFKSFLDRYPESDLADSARFYMADVYLSKGNFDRARKEFDEVLGVSRELRAAALLKRSYALAGLKERRVQIETLKVLIKEFPKSNEASTAQQILDGLEEKSESPKKKNNNDD